MIEPRNEDNEMADILIIMEGYTLSALKASETMRFRGRRAIHVTQWIHVNPGDPAVSHHFSYDEYDGQLEREEVKGMAGSRTATQYQ